MIDWHNRTYGTCPRCGGRPDGVISASYYEYGEGPYGEGDYGHAAEGPDVYDGTEDDTKVLYSFRGEWLCKNCINYILRSEGSVRMQENTEPTEKLIEEMGFQEL